MHKLLKISSCPLSRIADKKCSEMEKFVMAFVFIFSANGSGTDKRNGAASDCESDDGEEGDYTVYECPGLAPVSSQFITDAVFPV